MKRKSPRNKHRDPNAMKMFNGHFRHKVHENKRKFKRKGRKAREDRELNKAA